MRLGATVKGWRLSDSNTTASDQNPSEVVAAKPRTRAKKAVDPVESAEPATSSAATDDAGPVEPAVPSFLRLQPLTNSRIALALDAVGYSVDEMDPPTVNLPNYQLRGRVIGIERSAPTLVVSVMFLRAHAVRTYGTLLSLANEANMSTTALKLHVRMDVTSPAAAPPATGEDIAPPAAKPEPYCLLVGECEIPANTGIADVQLYDAIVNAVRTADAVVSRFPIVVTPKPSPGS